MAARNVGGGAQNAHVLDELRQFNIYCLRMAALMNKSALDVEGTIGGHTLISIFLFINATADLRFETPPRLPQPHWSSLSTSALWEAAGIKDFNTIFHL